MRADKATSIAKVAKVALENPLASQREIAEETGLSLGNVNDKLNKLEHEGKKDDRIIGITDLGVYHESLIELLMRQQEQKLDEIAKYLGDREIEF